MKALNKVQAHAALAAFRAIDEAGGIIKVWFGDGSTYADFKADGTVIVEHAHAANSLKIYADIAAFAADYARATSAHDYESAFVSASDVLYTANVHARMAR